MGAKREIIDGKLRCSVCKQLVPLEEFGPRLKYYRSSCNLCRRKQSKTWRKRNKEKIYAAKIASYYRHRDETCARRRAKAATPEGQIQKLKHRLSATYKISLEQYDYLRTIQNHVCALCGAPPRTKELGIDHDHSHQHTRKGRVGCPECIRGLLCDMCNGRILPIVEKHPHLQSDFVKRYLAGRPLVAHKQLIETEIKEINPWQEINLTGLGQPHSITAVN